MLILKAVGMGHDNDVDYFVCTEAFSGGLFGCLNPCCVCSPMLLVIFIVFDKGSYYPESSEHRGAKQRNIFSSLRCMLSISLVNCALSLFRIK